MEPTPGLAIRLALVTVLAAVVVAALSTRLAVSPRPADIGALIDHSFDVVAASPATLGEFGVTDRRHQPRDYIQISFDGLRQVYVNGAGCHYINGRFALTGGRLSTSGISANRIGCGPLEDDREWWFARLLTSSPTVITSGDDVILFNSDYQVVLRPHSEPVPWQLMGPTRLDPNARVVKVSLIEGSCASGRSPEGRILPPTIAYGPDTISISIRVRTLTSATCQGNAAYSYSVELAQPVGDRKVIDGSGLSWPF